MIEVSKFNDEKYIAHYTTFEALKNILITNRLRVSGINNFNDPYEKRFSSFINRDSSSSESNLNMQFEYLEVLKKTLVQHIKIFSTTCFDKENEQNVIDRHIYCRPRMWATYGDNNCGVCIIFNKEELREKLQTVAYKNKLICKAIDYKHIIEQINEETIELNDRQLLSIDFCNVEYLCTLANPNFLLEHRFFRKYYDWKTENEYRYLFFSEDTNDYSYACNIKESIEAIVFGIDSKDVDEKKCFVKHHLDKKPLYSLLFNENKYSTLL